MTCRKPSTIVARHSIQIVGVRGHGDGFDDEVVGLHGSEDEVRAAGVEGDDHPVVMIVHIR